MQTDSSQAGCTAGPPRADYNDGVFPEADCFGQNLGGHAMLLEGYDFRSTDANDHFWLVRNR